MELRHLRYFIGVGEEENGSCADALKVASIQVAEAGCSLGSDQR